MEKEQQTECYKKLACPFKVYCCIYCLFFSFHVLKCKQYINHTNSVTAYLTNGSYNVFVVDWGRLAQIPCYAASVHNMKPVGKCVAQLMSFLRDAGVPVSRTTCVGHSLGAHVCGVTANYLLFRMHRIIGEYRAQVTIICQSSVTPDFNDKNHNANDSFF